MAQQDKIAAVEAMTGHPQHRCREALEKSGWDIKIAAENMMRKDREITEERRRSRASSFGSVSTKQQDERRPSSGLDLKELEGYLFKQSKWRKKWNRRYISLVNGKLVTYRSREEAASNSSPRDVFELDSQSSVETCDAKDDGFSFVVKFAKKQVILAAETEDSRKLWMQAIGNVIKDGGSSSTAASIDPVLIEELSKMGFSESQARNALISTNGNVESAVDRLLSGDVPAAVPTKPTPPERRESLNMSVVQSEEEQLKRAIQASLQDSYGGGGNTSSSSSSTPFSSSPKEKMFEVKLPYDAIPGQRLRVEAPNGRMYMITVPTPIPSSRKIHMAYD